MWHFFKHLPSLSPTLNRHWQQKVNLNKSQFIKSKKTKTNREIYISAQLIPHMQRIIITALTVVNGKMTQPFTHFPWHHRHDMHHIRCDRPGALLPPHLAPVVELFPLKGQFRKVTAIKAQLFELLKLEMQKHFAQGLCLQFFPLFPPRLMGVGREVWWESFPVSESLCECPGSFSRASSHPL